MKKREADFTTLFRHWLKKYPMESACFELKQTTKDSIAFSAVKEHQLDALKAVVTGFSYKIPDDSRGIKPFDIVYLNRALSFVVIRYPKFFCLINVWDFVDEKERSKRKSLTSKRAQEIAVKVVILK